MHRPLLPVLLLFFRHYVMSDSVSPWTVACQAPLSMGLTRQAYWSRLPFPSPGDRSYLGIKSASPAWKVDSLPLKFLGSHSQCCCCCCCQVASVVSDSVQPHRRQPTRLPHPWDSPGKNTGVGCHFFMLPPIK